MYIYGSLQADTWRSVFHPNTIWYHWKCEVHFQRVDNNNLDCLISGQLVRASLRPDWSDSHQNILANLPRQQRRHSWARGFCYGNDEWGYLAKWQLRGRPERTGQMDGRGNVSGCGTTQNEPSCRDSRGIDFRFFPDQHKSIRCPVEVFQTVTSSVSLWQYWCGRFHFSPSSHRRVGSSAWKDVVCLTTNS